jgi:hypothetical protein
MRKKWEWIVAVCFIFLYLVVWKLLLSSISAVWFKNLAFFWIVSSFAVIPLAKFKKQNILLSLVFVFFLGPLALLLILFASPDMRYFSNEEKNERFYQNLIRQIDPEFNRAVSQKNKVFSSYTISVKLAQIAGYFKIVIPKDLSYIRQREYIELFKRIYEEFAKEYSAKFLKKFPGVEERLVGIAGKQDEFKMEEKLLFQKITAEYGKGKSAGMLLLLLQSLVLIVSLSITLCALVAFYYLFFSKAQPPDMFLFPILWVLNLCPPEHACPPFITWEAAQLSKLGPAFRLFLAAIFGGFISINFSGVIFFTLPELTGCEFKKERFAYKLFSKLSGRRRSK